MTRESPAECLETLFVFINLKKDFCDTLEVIVRRSDPEARVWRPFRETGHQNPRDTTGSSSVCGPLQQKNCGARRSSVAHANPGSACNLHGHSCFIALPQGRTIFHQQPLGDLRNDTMRDFGSFCARFCMWRQIKAQKRNWQHPCR